jgi:FtsP/CotA-like multicopper oxidase with cupredoxin domain
MRAKFASAGRRLGRLRWLPLLAAGALASLLVPIPGGAQNATPSEGLVCSTSSSSSFVRTTQVGYITTPDGNSIYMWGYGLGNQAFQYPGPVLCVAEGDTVTVTLKNTLPLPSSLVFPGLTQVKADGKPVSLDVASNSLSKPAGANGGTVTYTFTANDPGSFLYESGTDPELQTRMGLVGALIVRPKLNKTAAIGTSYVYDDPSTAYNSNREFMHLLSEIDPHMHHGVEVEMCQSAPDPACVPTLPPTYDMTTYLPRYFMINGRSFPDTITPNFSTAVPSQPYGALVHIMPKNNTAGEDYNPLPAVVRFLNAGPVNYPFHPHSNHDENIGLDGRVLINTTGAPQPTNISYDHFGFVVTPGQTAEALFNWTDAQNWDPQTNPVDVPIPSAQNRGDGPFWSGTPYLGMMAPLLNGVTQWNQCGEYYHFAHSHDLVHVTNYGAPGGGMLTLIRVDPPPSVQRKYGQNCNGGPGWN